MRYYSSPPELSGCIRVSVGLPEHTVRLKSAALEIYGKFEIVESR